MHWFLLSLSLIFGVAHSQEPAPDGRESSQKSKAQPKSGNTAAAKDQRGTAQSPFVVQVLPSENAHTKSQSEQRHENEKTATDELIAYATIALAAITFFLALYTAKLWKATVKLGSEAKDTSERQAREMEQSLSIAKASADAATESAKLSRADFASTHRPRLIVRRIYFRSASQIAYEVANIGATGAEILGIKQMLCFDKLPAGSPSNEVSTHVGATYIHAGTYFEFIHVITDEKVLEEWGFREGWANAKVLGATEPIVYFLGHVAYKDRLGVGRRTAFCRIYDFSAERFMPMPKADQDYEHVD